MRAITILPLLTGVIRAQMVQAQENAAPSTLVPMILRRPILPKEKVVGKRERS